MAVVVVVMMVRKAQHTPDATFDSTYHSADCATNSRTDRTSVPVAYGCTVFGTVDNALGVRARRYRKKGQNSYNHDQSSFHDRLLVSMGGA